MSTGRCNRPLHEKPELPGAVNEMKFMPDDNQPNLITPDGLHYECTGCGKCCSGWSVPMTEQDYQRIVAIDWGSLDPALKDKKLFRPLTAQQKLNTPYTHAI